MVGACSYGLTGRLGVGEECEPGQEWDHNVRRGQLHVSLGLKTADWPWWVMY